MRLSQQPPTASRLEDLFFQIIDKNSTIGKGPLPSRSTMKEQIGCFENYVESLLAAVRANNPELVRVAIVSHLHGVAELYGRMMFAVPAFWGVPVLKLTDERASELEDRVPGLIFEHLTAMRVLYGLAFSSVYVAMEAVVRQMTCHLLELSNAYNFDPIEDLATVVKGGDLQPMK